MTWGEAFTESAVADVVHRHLDGPAARTYLAASRPALRLVPAADGDDVLARLGDAPVLPDDVEWPAEPETGPMSFVGEIDLAAVARSGVDLSDLLPATGRLLLFHAEGDFPGADTAAADGGPWDPGERRASRLVHVEAPRESSRRREIPEGTPVRPGTILTGRPILTWPSPYSAAAETLHETLGADEDTLDELVDELEELHGDEPHHRIGGWARPQGIPAEEDVDGEAEDYRLVVQVDTISPSHVDALDWNWGDLGTISWLVPVSADPAQVVDRWQLTLDF